MKLHKILLTASFLLGGLCASAQEEVTEYDFTPHFFGQAQIGIQETLGEGPFGKLLSPNAQLAVGYQFNPVLGLRLAVNSWQSKGTLDFKVPSFVAEAYPNTIKGAEGRYNWKWNYIAPTVDLVVNMTNLIGGYNPTRLVDVNLYGGIGLNVAWNNKEAKAVNNKLMGLRNEVNTFEVYENGKPTGETTTWPQGNVLQNIWGHSRARFVGQVGADVNFNVSSRVQIGLELMANVLPDTYNSKKAPNADWYFNALVGVKYAFGPRYSKRTRVIESVPCEPQIIEKVVEKIVEVPVQVVEEKKEVQSFRRDVFFKINKSIITPAEMTKVEAVAEYLKAHPDAKVTVTGYADKGTGTKQYNLRLSAKRAEVVANTLQTKYGISASRIMVKSMGDDEFQPYPDPVQNRVAICIAE